MQGDGQVRQPAITYMTKRRVNVFGRKKKMKEEAKAEEWKRQHEERIKENGYLKLKLSDESENEYKLYNDTYLDLYINGYIFDLVLTDIIFYLLKNEICMPRMYGLKDHKLFHYFMAEDLMNEIIHTNYPPETLIRCIDDSQVIAFNPIKKNLIAEEVIERCGGHGAASRMNFYVLAHDPNEIKKWPLAELNKLEELENCKFEIYADENWETVYVKINPKFITKQQLIEKIKEVLNEYNIPLEVNM